jgi:ATP-dependent DNA helicase RecQ
VFAPGAVDAPLTKNLLDGVVRVLKEWPWAERPVGVVAMPSASRPQLVGSLAEAISTVGRLPLLGSLTPTRPSAGRGSGGGGNSVYRLADVWQAVEVGPELAESISPDTWVQWVYRWSASSGGHTLRVRATSADGTVQSETELPPAPNGAEGWDEHAVTVR